jgi:hypothetical protein
MDSNGTLQAVQSQPEQMLRCSMCEIEKSINEFYPQPQRRRGYSSNCKTCISARRRKSYAERTLRRDDDRYAGPPGEYTGEQVESVIKVMAALEKQVREAKAGTGMHIEAVEAEGIPIVDEIIGRIESLRQELKRMCARLATGKKPFSAFCRHGRAHYYGGELSVTLFPDVVLDGENET